MTNPVDYPSLLQQSGGWSPEVAVLLIVGDPVGGGFVQISSQVPPELQTFYAGKFGTANVTRAVIQMYPDSNDYWYQVVGTSTNPNLQRFYGEGWVASGTVTEYRFTAPANPLTLGAETGLTAETFLFQFPIGAVGGGKMSFGTANALAAVGQVSWNRVDVTFGVGDAAVGGHATSGDLIWGSQSLGRGTLQTINVTTVGGLTAAASAETDIPNFHMFSVPVFADRIYRITLQLPFSSTVATDSFSVNIRRTTALTGTTIASGYGSGTENFFTGIWDYNPPADNLTENFFVSFARRTGTGTFTPFGSPGGGVNRTCFTVEDLCSSAQYVTT